MRLQFHKDALKEYQSLEKTYREAFKKKLSKLLSGKEQPSPRNTLHGFPRGYYKIKLRKAGLRLVYRYDGKYLVVLVLAIGKRERNLVYEVARSRQVPD